MPAKKKRPVAGAMGHLKANVLLDTENWFRDKAKREGVTMQSLIAPILNAVARGEIRGGFEHVPAPHGNVKQVA